MEESKKESKYLQIGIKILVLGFEIELYVVDSETYTLNKSMIN